MVTPTTAKWNKQTSRYLNALDQINIHLVIYFWYCFVVMVLICSEKQKDYIYIPQRLIHVPYKGGGRRGSLLLMIYEKRGFFIFFGPSPPSMDISGTLFEKYINLWTNWYQYFENQSIIFFSVKFLKINWKSWNLGNLL